MFAPCRSLAMLAASLVLAVPAVTRADDASVGPEWDAFTKIAGAFHTAQFEAATHIYGDTDHFSVIRVTFRKPNFARCEVIDGDGAGGVAIWRGGAKVLVRPPGLLSRFVLALDRNDPHVVDARGRGCGEITLDTFASSFAAGGTLKETPGPAIDGAATDTVEWTRDGSGSGDTRRVLAISKATHLPLEFKGYKDTTLVEDSTYRNIKIDPEVPFDTFDLK